MQPEELDQVLRSLVEKIRPALAELLSAERIRQPHNLVFRVGVRWFGDMEVYELPEVHPFRRPGPEVIDGPAAERHHQLAEELQ